VQKGPPHSSPEAAAYVSPGRKSRGKTNRRNRGPAGYGGELILSIFGWWENHGRRRVIN
jgi:hypothetical protein